MGVIVLSVGAVWWCGVGEGGCGEGVVLGVVGGEAISWSLLLVWGALGGEGTMGCFDGGFGLYVLV